MCGRFALQTPAPLVASRYFGIDQAAVDDTPRYNITPGVGIAGVLRSDEQTVMVPLHWGFRPPWAASSAPAPINIRAEKAATSPYFRAAFAHQRCLIPATGWYEWQTTEQGKQPFFVTLKAEDPDAVIFFAGLWAASAVEGQRCCGIITEPAATAFASVHPRQPLVLDPACRWAWLDSAVTDRGAVRQAAKRLPADRLVAYPVSSRVNTPRNDDPGLLEPTAPSEDWIDGAQERT